MLLEYSFNQIKCDQNYNLCNRCNVTFYLLHRFYFFSVSVFIQLICVFKTYAEGVVQAKGGCCFYFTYFILTRQKVVPVWINLPVLCKNNMRVTAQVSKVCVARTRNPVRNMFFPILIAFIITTAN